MHEHQIALSVRKARKTITNNQRGEHMAKRAIRKGDEVRVVRHESSSERAGLKEGDVFTVADAEGRGFWRSIYYETPDGNSFGIPAGYLERIEKPKKRKVLDIDITNRDEIVGQDKTKKYLQVAVEKNIPTLLVGETGTGKTSIIRQLAKDNGVEYFRFAVTGETTTDDLVGKMGLKAGETEFEGAFLYEHAQKPVYVVIDEINMALPEVLAVFQSLLDDERKLIVPATNEVIDVHPDFRLFATMNPVQEYAGTKELNKALKSRFGMTIEVDYVKPEVEVQIVKQKCNIKIEQANTIVDFAIMARKAKKEDQIFYTCSTRDLIQWGDLLGKLPMQTAFELTVLNKSEQDAPTLKEMYKNLVKEYKEYKKEGFELTIDSFQKLAEGIRQERRELQRAKEMFEEHKEETKRTIKETILRELMQEKEQKAEA